MSSAAVTAACVLPALFVVGSLCWETRCALGLSGQVAHREAAGGPSDHPAIGRGVYSVEFLCEFPLVSPAPSRGP